MANINRGRFVLAGLAAGVTMNLVSFASWGLYAQEMLAILKALDIVPPKSLSFFAVYLLMRFTWGFVAVWIYAMARSRYGPGVKTAIAAGAVYWVGSLMLGVISYGMMGLFPVSMLVKWAGITWVAIMFSTIVGAWVYRES